MSTLVDTHAHIHSDFDDAAGALDRAAAAGVERVVTLGVDARDSVLAADLAQRDARVFAAAGIHPHYAAGASDEDFALLRDVLNRPHVVAVGEIGLDFYRNNSPQDAQERVFARQLEIAAELRLPVAVHTNEAMERMDAILLPWARRVASSFPSGRPLGVMHYFTGDVSDARRYHDAGLLISVHTRVTRISAVALHRVARELPLEALVLETDSPFGPPRRVKGRNEPAYVCQAAQAVAELRGITVDEVARATTANALALFGLGAAARA